MTGTLSGGAYHRTVFSPGVVPSCFLWSKVEVFAWWRFEDHWISVCWRHARSDRTECFNGVSHLVGKGAVMLTHAKPEGTDS